MCSEILHELHDIVTETPYVESMSALQIHIWLKAPKHKGRASLSPNSSQYFGLPTDVLGVLKHLILVFWNLYYIHKYSGNIDFILFSVAVFSDTRDLLYFVHPACIHLTILHTRLWNNKYTRKTVLLCWVWLMVNFFLEKIFCGNLNEVILLIETALFRIPRKMFLKSKLSLRTDNE